MNDGKDRRGNVRAVVRVAAGNFLEMYDFMVFGYYAAAIGHVSGVRPDRGPFRPRTGTQRLESPALVHTEPSAPFRDDDGQRVTRDAVHTGD